MATLHEPWRKEMTMWWRFIANFRVVPLAAIGHGHANAGRALEQLAGKVG
jgi:hypothetical protein